MDDLKSYFTSLGYRFDWGKPRIHKELRKLMGAQMHEHLLEQLDLVGTGMEDGLPPFSIPNTYKQAALLFSFDGLVGVTTAATMSEALQTHLESGMTVADMGCGVGGLVSWLAIQYPNITFKGVDAADNLISAATERFKVPNLSFEVADYSSDVGQPHAFDIIVSVFGVEFGAGPSLPCGIDIHSMRGSPSYKAISDDVSPAFRSWRTAAKPNSKLLFLVRASGAEHLLPVLDAAQKNGWRWDLKGSQMAFIFEGGPEAPPTQRMPLLVFSATSAEGSCDSIDVEEAFNWYSMSCFHPRDEDGDRPSLHPHVVAEQILTRASVEFQAHQDYDDGHSAHAMILREGNVVHLLRRATTGYCLVDTKRGCEDAEAIEDFRRNPL